MSKPEGRADELFIRRCKILHGVAYDDYNIYLFLLPAKNYVNSIFIPTKTSVCGSDADIF